MNVIELDSSYKGKTLSFDYISCFYYDLELSDEQEVINARLVRRRFEASVHKQFEGVLLEDFLNNPLLFTAQEEGQVYGSLELGFEGWNNRMRITTFLLNRACGARALGISLCKKPNRLRKHTSSVHWF